MRAISTKPNPLQEHAPVKRDRDMRAISTSFHKIDLFRTSTSACNIPDMPATRDYRRKGTRQLRPGRYSDRNQIYHVNTSTHQRIPIFLSLTNGRLLTRTLMRAQTEGHVETLAFVIMPDHLHWLLRLAGNKSLAKCIGAVKSESARKIGAHRGHTGPVWQSGFYDRAIRQEDDVVDVARYIIANPVRAGIVRSVQQYALWDTVWV